ncbi:hypothetical protein E4H04_07525 [Candidatus Bathyarchaeota archaeon]|jgi:hypothetical protein|nr:MAG: hypothetical protein E4H04_07525 [Candidatus Bathyarchaeota archaeon]
MKRFEVRMVEGPPRGGLYELEQTTYFHVVDLQADEILLKFQGEMEASLSRDTGLWEDHRYSGVCEVVISPDEKTALVKYHNGNQEFVALPEFSE